MGQFFLGANIPKADEDNIAPQARLASQEWLL